MFSKIAKYKLKRDIKNFGKRKKVRLKIKPSRGIKILFYKNRIKLRNALK